MSGDTLIQTGNLPDVGHKTFHNNVVIWTHTNHVLPQEGGAGGLIKCMYKD